MKKDDGREIISYIVAFLAMLLADAMPNLLCRLVFIVLVVIEIVLYYKGRDNTGKKIHYATGILAVALAVMLLVAIIGVGSIPEYTKQVISFFAESPTEQTQQEGQKEQIEQDEAAAYDAYQASRSEMEQQLAAINLQLGDAASGIAELSDSFSKYGHFSRAESQQEIDALVEIIAQLHNDAKDEFPNLKTDKNEIQLFYKMKFHDQIYHYCNIVKAFEEYGIDCEEMSIDEHTLILWDVESLYIYYSIKQQLGNALVQNTFYPYIEFRFNDYKIEKNEYSDTFNYGDQKVFYENITAEQLNDTMDAIIKSYYIKFVLNFMGSID